MSKEIINDVTGEVLETPKFRSMWCNPFGIIKQDNSSHFEDVYTEIPAYAIDPETGKLLNDSSVPKLVKTGKIDVWEKIQSVKKEADLYSILEKFAYSGDNSLLNARPCSYGDISNIPDNINDYTKFVDAHFKNLKSLNPELAKMVIDDSISSEIIENKANDILNNRIESINKSKSNLNKEDNNK